MSKENKKLIEYNAKGGVYAVDGGTVKPLGYLTGVQKDRTINTKDIYGDGEVQKTAVTEAPSSITLGLTAKDDEFDTDLGYLMSTATGLAEVKASSFKKVDIGFETTIETKTGIKQKKVWLLNCQVSPAGDSWQQNTESTNEVNASYSALCNGVKLMDTAGTAEYVDPTTGQTVTVFMISAVPQDSGYVDFLKTVPTPKANASQPG